MEYPKLRDSETEFNNKAKAQASYSLAAKGGKIDPFGRHSLGNDDLEKEAFSLQPGEVTRLVETPEGIVLLKCDERIPADTSVNLEQVRSRLMQEVRKKKIDQEMSVVFNDLRQTAKPKLLLKDSSRPEDLNAEVLPELAGLNEKGPAPVRGK
jgi:parvulin-like peptidyl-prolyl isomerase